MNMYINTSYAYLLLNLLLWDEKPPDADNQTDTCADAQRSSRTNTIDQYAADETSQKQADDSHDLMIARNDNSSDVKELGINHELTPSCREHDCSSELRVETLPHNALQAHARAHEADAHEGQHVGPCGVGARISNATLMALPDRNGGSHCKKGLNKGAEGQPQPCLAAQFIAEATDEGAKNERDQRAQRLTVRYMERVVVLPVEQAGKGKSQLYTVSRLERAPDKYSRECNRVDETSHEAIYGQGRRALLSIDFRK